MADSKYYSEQISRIDKVEFSLFSNEEVKRYSAVRRDPFGIDLPESYTDYEPKKGGLVDLRLGTCDMYLNCTTCGLNTLDCPGHFGHTDLAEPVFHFGFLNHVKTLTQCVCLRCSKLLVDKKEGLVEKYKKKNFASRSGKYRFKEIRELSKKATYCYNCGAPIPKVKKEIREGSGTIRIILEREVASSTKDEKTGVVTEIVKKEKEHLTPRRCYEIFRNIDDTDAFLLGFNPKIARPEDLIIKNFPIPPVIIRPTAKIDFMASSTSEDSLTLVIANIIRMNQRIRKQMNKELGASDIGNASIENAQILLQVHVATYFDNESIYLPKSEFKTGGKLTKSVTERIKGKQGRVRNNLMGKRVDFSARSVITSDPNINIDEVRVPLIVAMDLTVPEEVTPANYNYLSKLVANGRYNYPGANFVKRTIKVNGKDIVQKIDLRFRKSDIKLNYNDVVERHLLDGDPVLFNRQPTLHKPSMMCHKARVVKNPGVNTFGINVSVTEPYNADFDGDEMNLFLPQSVQARNELEMIANVKRQIISVRGSNPIIACKQDAITGANLLSTKGVTLTAEEAYEILAYTNVEDLRKFKKGETYTGLEVFSMIIPDGINAIKKNDDGKITFQVKDGELKVGTLSKDSLAAKKNSLIHYVWDKYGPDHTQKFIDEAQRLVINYLHNRGYTIGFGDCFIKREDLDSLRQIVKTKALEANYLLTELENQGENITKATFEDNLRSHVQAISSNIAGMVDKLMTLENNLGIMVTYAKAKGTTINLGSIMACVGQQSVEGSRIKKKVRGRTIPHFHKDDDTAPARGFVANSYLDGLEGHEFFFHTMGGREGLIDTAIKSVTWETPIVIIENGQPKYTEIGRWIDASLDNQVNKDKVKHYTDRQMELLDIDNVFIPTMDEDGIVTWAPMTAITRHDPGTELYEIKTSGGRSVIVTESKSLLIWDSEGKKFKEVLTPEIEVGDFVPVTESLCQPPVIMAHVDMTKYLPKNEYLYGTDYHKAIEMMNQAMEGRDKIPAGWWDENNGKEFNLPYSKKSSLQRCSVRSNQENIKSGYVFPYAAQRNDTMIPDQFELNEENGIMIGLYLAEGSVSNDAVRITNNNENVKNFVKKWFEKHNINWEEDIKVNHIGGISNTVRGFSSVLSNFLIKFAGHGAENKFVPTEAFIAPEEFIIGLLNGYYSGDGCVTKNSIDASSASKRLIEGISMLCSRINVFGKVYTTIIESNNLGTKNIKPSHRFRISAQWAQQFSDKITLLEDVRNQKMKEKKWCKSHRNFNTHNNVVLDEIVEINLIDVKLHPKVYDVTVPATLNFGLANGLQVRDTAQTGYIQRRLVKSFEDMVVGYDGNVKNAAGQTIQYIYGDNGINQAVQTEIKLSLVAANNDDIKKNYIFSNDELKKVKNYDAKDNDNYYKKMKAYRDELRNIQRRATLSSKVIQEQYMLPVNIIRIVQDHVQDKSSNDLSPKEIEEKIEEFLKHENTRLMTFNVGKDMVMKERDERHAKYILEVALHEYLAPKRCLFEYNFSKNDFNALMDDLKVSYQKAVIEPGEMVGIISAQSIGEPTSQMTLNTKHFAGVASARSLNMGAGRIEEIINYSKDIKTPLMEIYLQPEHRGDKTTASRIAAALKYVTIGNLVKGAQIYYHQSKDGSDIDKIISQDQTGNPFFINNQKADLDSLPWVFRIELDREKMMEKDVSLLDIKAKFTAYWYQLANNTKTMGKVEKDLYSFLSRGAILSNFDTSSKPTIHIRVSLTQFNNQILNNFLKFVLNQITLKGINGIGAVEYDQQRLVNYDEDTGDQKIEQEYFIATNGINPIDIKKMKGIDHSRTYFNDIDTVYRLYGVEAARRIITTELQRVFSAGGAADLNFAHLSLLSDFMTHTGEIIPIDRHGSNKLDTDPISRASFEKTMEHFVNAALFNETDQVRSTSARVALGRVIQGGTGCFDLVLDTGKLENSEYLEDELKGVSKAPMFEENSFFKDLMSQEDVNVDFFIPQK